MRFLIFIFSLFITSCSTNSQKADIPVSLTDSLLLNSENTDSEFSWIGMINEDIPVFISYVLDSSLIVGEITYLNTKNRTPIKLVGTVEDDKNFRILEFDETGNITGIISGLPGETKFSGRWFSPKTRKELSIQLTRKDTVINLLPIITQLEDVFGHYHYQYSEAGYQGDLEISKLPESKATFRIFSVTSDPARNIAEVEEDIVNLKGTSFIYRIPRTDTCDFLVKFYRDFAYIRYTKGYCEGQFGMNSTIDGIFLKIN
jgi:hypothetical protein